MLQVELLLDAPVEQVWELWTTAEGIASWFGPRGFEVEVTECDLRVGGSFVYIMRASPEMAAMMQSRGDGAVREIRSTFTVVEAPKRLAYDSPWGSDVMSTDVTFTETPDGVRMELVIDATRPEMTEGADRGWISSLDRLAERLRA